MGVDERSTNNLLTTSFELSWKKNANTALILQFLKVNTKLHNEIHFMSLQKAELTETLRLFAHKYDSYLLKESAPRRT